MFGPVALTPTTWRLMAAVDERLLYRLRSARAQAREVAWLQVSETPGGIPAAMAGGQVLPGLVLDIDATLITCHSEYEAAAPTYIGGFGFYPCCVSWPTPRTIGTDMGLGTQPDSLHVESALRLDRRNPSSRFIVPGQEGTFAFPPQSAAPE